MDHTTACRFTPCVALILVLTAACGDDDGPDEAGVATASMCPTDSPPTYEDFAEPFMTAYCIRCHSSERTGTARSGAPDGHDFDTEEGILIVANHVDQYAAGGPAGVNTIMPPSGDAPTEADRRRLGQWLACAAHHLNDDAGADTDGGGHAHP